MKIKRIIFVLLLLCTALWISACGEQQEIMTAEMQPVGDGEPIVISVIMPDEGDIFSLLFQIDGIVYRAQGQPIVEEPLEPHIPLISEDGKQTAYLSIAGFLNEEASIKLQLFPEDMDNYWSWSYLWICETEAFLPLWNWLEQMDILKTEP